MTSGDESRIIPELLVPAGNLERLQVAVRYGADAVYLGGAGLDLRAFTPGFTLEQLEEGIHFAHQNGVKVYVAFNILAHNQHLDDAAARFKDIAELNPDAFIIADPGLWALARGIAPQIPVHLSTQAAVTNWRSVKFWADLGVQRVNLSRELSLKEVREIRNRVGIELETFVHGAMCLAYSGRCLLSAYFTGRGANQGECTQSCRWTYELYEESRPNDPLIIKESKGGSLILSSRDLCMIRHLPELVQAGLNSLKIEGRMKGTHYVATVTKAYRQALDRYLANPENYTLEPSWEEELSKISHRPYHSGFYFGRPEQVPPDLRQDYLKKCVMTGLVLGYEKDAGMAIVEQRNPFFKGDMLEVFGPQREPFRFQVKAMYNEEGLKINSAPHAQQLIRIPVEQELEALDIIRKYV